MSVTLVSTGVQFPDNTIQTTAASAGGATSFSYAPGTYTIDVPDGSTSMTMTGCAAGGGHAQLTNGGYQWVHFMGGGGGGAACINARIALASTVKRLRIVVGAGSTGSGGATSVSTSTATTGESFTTALNLGGGGAGLGQKANGTSYISLTATAGSGGTVSTGSIVGFTYNGQQGTTGTLSGSQSSNFNGAMANNATAGNIAGLGSGSTTSNWAHGSTDGKSGYGNRGISNLWGGGAGAGTDRNRVAYGFGSGAPGGLTSGRFGDIPARNGGNGFLILNFGG